jgi:hypothetical protein
MPRSDDAPLQNLQYIKSVVFRITRVLVCRLPWAAGLCLKPCCCFTPVGHSGGRSLAGLDECNRAKQKKFASTLLLSSAPDGPGAQAARLPERSAGQSGAHGRMGAQLLGAREAGAWGGNHAVAPARSHRMAAPSAAAAGSDAAKQEGMAAAAAADAGAGGAAADATVAGVSAAASGPAGRPPRPPRTPEQVAVAMCLRCGVFAF